MGVQGAKLPGGIQGGALTFLWFTRLPCRQRAGAFRQVRFRPMVARGIINAGSAVVGIVSPILFGLMIDRTGNRTAPFIGSIALLPPGALIALLIRPDGRLEMVAKSPLPAVVRTPLGAAG